MEVCRGRRVAGGRVGDDHGEVGHVSIPGRGMECGDLWRVGLGM